MQSECMPWRTLARVQLSPSSALIMTPWPIVPTRMVPRFAMAHLLTSSTFPRRDYTPRGQVLIRHARGTGEGLAARHRTAHRHIVDAEERGEGFHRVAMVADRAGAARIAIYP